MKRLTISLSDELFDEIDAMPNKNQFVRRLIEQNIELSAVDEFESSKTAESLSLHNEIIVQLQSKVNYLEAELKRVFEAIDMTNFIVGAVDEKLDSVMPQISTGVSGYDTTNATGINPVKQNIEQPLTVCHQIDLHSNAGGASLQTADASLLDSVELGVSENMPNIADNISNNIDNTIDIDVDVSSDAGDKADFLKRTMIYLPMSTRMKREIIENLLGRHFGRDVTGELNNLIEQGIITETVNDDIKYLKR